jgi:hypothetical protein
VSIRFDHGDVDKWALTLDRALSAVPEEAAKVVEKGALNIKQDAQRRIGRPAHAPAYASSISYDMRRAMRGPEAEIGPDKNKRQGDLGNLLEYGSVNNSARPHVAPAAEAEVPKYERAMEELAASLLEDQ